jgi:hypothetical protein
VSRETIADHIPWNEVYRVELIEKGICPRCEGSGSIEGETYTADNEDRISKLEQSLEPCDECHATGKLCFDLKEVEILSFSGIDHSDYPDYCDAFIEEALYRGNKMTEGQLEVLRDEYSEFVYEKLMEHIF